MKCSTTADFSDLESAILAHSNIASASGQVNEIVVEHETEGRDHDAEVDDTGNANVSDGDVDVACETESLDIAAHPVTDCDHVSEAAELDELF